MKAAAGLRGSAGTLPVLTRIDELTFLEVNEFKDLDLLTATRRVLTEAGLATDFPAEALHELPRATPEVGNGNINDLRHLLWSSIDNRESRDLDQIEVVEPLSDGSIRLRLGIADVDAFVPKDSTADRFAAQNTTSIYAGIATFPLFPPELSNELTSLLEDRDRLAVVIGMIIDREGAISAPYIERAWVRNQAKLSYEEVGAWLENTGPLPSRAASLPALADQLRLQWEVAERLRRVRVRAGALEFESIEPRAVVRDGRVIDLAVKRKDSARVLIENLMIAANSAMATFLESREWPSIQRVVHTPERWPRIVALAAEHGTQLPPAPDSAALAEFLDQMRRTAPETFADLSLAVVKLIGAGEYVVVRNAREPFGHFGLALQDYAHGTAPNRRYSDVIIQRLLKAAIAGETCPYTPEELERIAHRCNEMATAARRVERQMRKIEAAAFMSHRVGEEFSGMITGASPKGTFVRVKSPPIEGRIVQGEAGLEVGDTVRVRLLSTDQSKGFIDFARTSPDGEPVRRIP